MIKFNEMMFMERNVVFIELMNMDGCFNIYASDKMVHHSLNEKITKPRNFIELSQINGWQAWINLDHIVYVIGNQVHLSTGMFCEVKESNDLILELIREIIDE